MGIFRNQTNRLSGGIRKGFAALVFGFSVTAGAPAGTEGARVEDASFPPTVEAGDRDLRLSGAGLYRKFMFRVYANALYVPDGWASGDGLAGTPRCLEFHYFREITPEQLAEAARNWLEKNLDGEKLRAISPELERMNALYETVSEGDRYRLCHLPGEGTTLDFNGSRVGTVTGDDFAEAYFQIWLGENSIDNDLRDRLLGTGS